MCLTSAIGRLVCKSILFSFYGFEFHFSIYKIANSEIMKNAKLIDLQCGCVAMILISLETILSRHLINLVNKNGTKLTKVKNKIYN